MAGHSKWANIKHKKASQDSKKSKNFQKISKEIMVSIKTSGNNPETNAKLRLLIEKAKTLNIPSVNIKKLLEKNDRSVSNFSEVIYEGYGPGGVAILVETLTDNINRTVGAVKSIFTKAGGNLGTNGSVSYLFSEIGIIVLDKEIYPIDKWMETFIDLDLIDLEEENEVIILKVEASKLETIGNLLKEKGINEFIEFEVTKKASNEAYVSDEIAEKIQRLIDNLLDNDDVQNVYSNLYE